MTTARRRRNSPEPFAERVIAWQHEHGRHGLPWQGTRDPYRVWLSEIMLQQTQVATVIGYYDRFLQRFPNVEALATAPLDDVLALWAGLGYYSRARMLHRCAIDVVQRHGGQFPPTAQALADLPGIGPSTAAAIAAFCFGERAAILDGNVKRVLARWLAFDGDLSQAAPQRELLSHAQALLPHQGIAAYTQGLMDIGSAVCTQRQPRCDACPVAAGCAAHSHGDPQRYPVKTKRLKRGRRENVLLMITCEDQIWLVQRPASGVWGGLWSLPAFADEAALAAALPQRPRGLQRLPSVQHALTHFDWTLHVRWLRLDGDTDIDSAPQTMPGRWVAASDLHRHGLPAPVRAIVESAWPALAAATGSLSIPAY
jgi:A/G-specific adenine glycosylase